MLVWINGSFGAGKSTIARALSREYPRLLEFDPERIGFMLRDMTPVGCRTSDFQDLPLWRELVVRTAVGLSAQCARPLVIPMTVANESYFEEIMAGFRDANVEVRHFTLLASTITLRKRLWRRWSTPSSKKWALAQTERTANALLSPRFAVHIETDGRTVQEVMNHLASCLSDIQ